MNHSKAVITIAIRLQFIYTK